MATTTLNGAIDNTVTEFDVIDASGFPTPSFRIVVESEYMLITSVNTNTFTVTRGDIETTAASHIDGTTVDYVISMDIGTIPQIM